MECGGNPAFVFSGGEIMTLQVGRISYLNTIPFFHYLAQTGFAGRVTDGVPAELNARLAVGEIDLSPSSSFEYAVHWRDYLLLPGYSISSLGPVHSVLLFSRLPLAAVASEEIALTGESATSVNLLGVLLREFFGAAQVSCKVPQTPVEDVLAAGGSALLIGDRALRAARNLPQGMHAYDLGELWWQHTGLPFVFALWIVRRHAYVDKPGEIREFCRQLGLALELAFADLAGMAAAVASGSPLGAEELADYWRTVSYRLTPAHLAGLRRFFALCAKHGLLVEEPELLFIDQEPVSCDVRSKA
jgi:chorismate dehydratase